MTKTLNCKKCGSFLGAMEKGKLRKDAVLLCALCWGRAELAIGMADMAASQARDTVKGSGDEGLEMREDMFGFGRKGTS